MSEQPTIEIEIVFATADRQQLLTVQVAEGTTARSAILSSPLIAEFPEFSFADCQLGIWGRVVEDDRCLLQGDRLEAYRELLHDPRNARRELASQGQSMGQQPDSSETAPESTIRDSD